MNKGSEAWVESSKKDEDRNKPDVKQKGDDAEKLDVKRFAALLQDAAGAEKDKIVEALQAAGIHPQKQ